MGLTVQVSIRWAANLFAPPHRYLYSWCYMYKSPVNTKTEVKLYGCNRMANTDNKMPQNLCGTVEILMQSQIYLKQVTELGFPKPGSFYKPIFLLLGKVKTGFRVRFRFWKSRNCVCCKSARGRSCLLYTSPSPRDS